MRTRRSRSLLAALPLALGAFAAAPDAHATRPLTIEDYRYFRSLSIDLNGRMPTRAEVAAFEADGFDVDHWIDQHLAGPAYAERVRRVYMDLLRLEIGSTFQFVPGATTLRRIQLVGPSGNPIFVYFRKGQRRMRAETDGEFCFTQAETGLQFPPNTTPTGTAHAITQAALDANTVVVRPWWLYRDYRSATPSDRYDPMTWSTRFSNYVPVQGVLMEPDGMTPTTEIRVCREEAATGAMGTVYTSGRTTAPPAGTPPPFGRLSQLPLDSGYARSHTGQPIACAMGSSLSLSADCGCGAGLERCMPADGPGFDPRGFNLPLHTPIGLDAPVDGAEQSQSSWPRFWWGQEAMHFLDAIFGAYDASSPEGAEHDMRDMLTAPYTWVNGPLAQFYRSGAPATCCGNAINLGYANPEPLLDPTHIPDTLLAHDTDRWVRVDPRSSHASGLLTMPVFLTKFGSRRARAHVLYNAFMCREFVAQNVTLAPSTEPNLMIRPGCANCHATLEPMAAYFSRIVESDWTFLPAGTFPTSNSTCGGADPMHVRNGSCANYYDPAFVSPDAGVLRGAYASPEHANEGPAGVAQALITDPDFAGCIASNIATSFLGRPLTDEDNELRDSLAATLTANGYHASALVRSLVHSEAYRNSNNLTSTALRDAGLPLNPPAGGGR